MIKIITLILFFSAPTKPHKLPAITLSAEYVCNYSNLRKQVALHHYADDMKLLKLADKVDLLDPWTKRAFFVCAAGSNVNQEVLLSLYYHTLHLRDLAVKYDNRGKQYVDKKYYPAYIKALESLSAYEESHR